MDNRGRIFQMSVSTKVKLNEKDCFWKRSEKFFNAKNNKNESKVGLETDLKV